MQLSKEGSQTRDHRGRANLEHRKHVTKQRALANCIPQREGQLGPGKEVIGMRSTHRLWTSHGGRDKSGHGNKATKQRAPTVWRPQKEVQVRTQKESDLLRGTHFLETEQEGTGQDMERM